MKTLSMIAMLFVVVACNGKSGGDSKGEVDALTAGLEVPIELNDGKFKILETKETGNSDESDYASYSCSLAVKGGTELGYTVNGDELAIYEGGVTYYRRVSGESGSIIGSWTTTEHDIEGDIVTTLTFTQDKLAINANCQF